MEVLLAIGVITWVALLFCHADKTGQPGHENDTSWVLYGLYILTFVIAVMLVISTPFGIFVVAYIIYKLW